MLQRRTRSKKERPVCNLTHLYHMKKHFIKEFIDDMKDEENNEQNNNYQTFFFFKKQFVEQEN